MSFWDTLTILWGHSKIVNLLIQNGAKINATDEENRTALNLAVNFKRKEIVKILVDKGADLNIKDRQIECTLFRSSCLISLPFGPPSDIDSKVTWPKFGPIWAKIELPPPITNLEAYLYKSKN